MMPTPHPWDPTGLRCVDHGPFPLPTLYWLYEDVIGSV